MRSKRALPCLDSLWHNRVRKPNSGTWLTVCAECRLDIGAPWHGPALNLTATMKCKGFRTYYTRLLQRRATGRTLRHPLQQWKTLPGTIFRVCYRHGCEPRDFHDVAVLFVFVSRALASWAIHSALEHACFRIGANLTGLFICHAMPIAFVHACA